MALAASLLRRHIEHRAQYFSFLRYRHVGRLPFRQAEVGYVRLVGLVHEDVAGLEIAMNDASGMHVVNAARDFREKFRCFSIGQSPALPPFFKVLAVDEIADDIRQLSIHSGFVDTDDVLMIQLCNVARFLKKADSIVVLQLIAPRELDGDEAIELSVAGLPNRAKSALANLLHQFKLPNAERRFRSGLAVHAWLIADERFGRVADWRDRVAAGGTS